MSLSNYAERPGKLFEGAERNLSIMISQKGINEICDKYTTYYHKWKAENRSLLFTNIKYQSATNICTYSTYPKISSLVEVSLMSKLRRVCKNIGYLTLKKSSYVFYYKNSGGRYWKFMANFQPIFYLNGKRCASSRETHLYFENNTILAVITSILNSTLYYWYYVMNSDARTNNPSDLKDFPFDYDALRIEHVSKLIALSEDLMRELQDNAVMVDAKYRTGKVQFAQYLPAISKPIIDEIDKVLAKHYGFTEEELDFIINYDIKYRMGDELNDSE